MTAQPRTLTDDQWRRMSWHAQQQWLIAANAQRRTIAADIARLADERATVKAAPVSQLPAREVAVDASKRRSGIVLEQRATRPIRGTVILHGQPALRVDERTAQQILDELGPDPDAGAHWLVLTEVIETTCTARGCTTAVEPGTRCPTHAARTQRAA